MTASRAATSLPKPFQYNSHLLRIKGLTLFQAHYSPHNLVPYIASRYLADFDNPIRPKVVHAYRTRERGILWWTVMSGHLAGMRPVVRTWYARRVRLGFRAALGERGYDGEGRKREGGRGLRGTVEIRMGRLLFGAGREEVARQLGLLVEGLEGKMAERGRGKGMGVVDSSRRRM
ncbi:hypothetical protein PRK78_004820 [Emydomyces testavorans]|uniref:Uncharacterized protein n=1 Tax=Emydomyces testavorans TaxID=2070801 RepID=A0AAF0IIY5_9EURO|nr:hypothetical protein PRK78_004820 [Emydomyces testavorans]